MNKIGLKKARKWPTQNHMSQFDPLQADSIHQVCPNNLISYCNVYIEARVQDLEWILSLNPKP